MFLLYAIVIGFAVGFLLGGRPSGLATLNFRWAPLALIGLAVQIVLFSGPSATASATSGRSSTSGRPRWSSPWSSATSGSPGMALVALGAVSNLLAIVANGGYMPSSPAAAAAAGQAEATTYSNSAIVDGRRPGAADRHLRHARAGCPSRTCSASATC